MTHEMATEPAAGAAIILLLWTWLRGVNDVRFESGHTRGNFKMSAKCQSQTLSAWDGLEIRRCSTSYSLPTWTIVSLLVLAPAHDVFPQKPRSGLHNILYAGD
jgi:hypothetical protein